jgi:hypothetical protein
MLHSRDRLAPILLAPALLAAALSGCAGARNGGDVAAAVVVVIPPPLPENPASKADADANAKADRDRMSSPDSLLGRWREEFDGRSGCADEAVITRSGPGLSVHMENCNDKKAYVTKKVTYDGTELRVELVAPESSFPIRYTLKRTQRGVLEGHAAVGDDEEPSRHKVKWLKDGK